jgi:cytochrome c-type biogenesis protein CcmH/NrfG
MSLLVAVYLGFALVYAAILLRDDYWVVNAMGYALLIIPLVGAWGLAAEWRFGVGVDRMRHELLEQGLFPDEFHALASGRPDKDHAATVFDAFKDHVEQSPDSWVAWCRLGVAYDAAGDRSRARWAMRRALRLRRAK